MIEVRTTTLAPYSEQTIRAARQLYNHCPDCGGHTRIMVIHGAPDPEKGTVSGPPPATIFFCDRCSLALLVVHDPAQSVALEQSLPRLLQSAGVLVKDWWERSPQQPS